MKLLLVLSLFFNIALAEEQTIIGQWFYIAKIYQGIEIPEHPESTLRLHFDFSVDGQSRLYWWHQNEGDFCERIGKYRIEAGNLVDEVTWINPKNSPGCGLDPDMQLGRVTTTAISFRGSELLLHLYIGNEPLIYVWKKIAPEEQ